MAKVLILKFETEKDYKRWLEDLADWDGCWIPPDWDELGNESANPIEISFPERITHKSQNKEKNDRRCK